MIRHSCFMHGDFSGAECPKCVPEAPMTHPTPEEIVKLIGEPKRLEVLLQALAEPDHALKSLDLLIRSPSSSHESRKNYIGLRNALEAYLEEARK